MKKLLCTLTMAAALGGMHANAANSITAANVEGKPGETVNVEIKLTSDGAVAGYQVNIKANKAGLTLGTATTTGAATLDDAWIGSKAVTTTSYNLLCYSETCKTYASKAEKIVAVIPVTIPADAAEGTYTFTLGKGVVSDATGVAASCADASFTITVKAASVKGDYDGVGGFDINDIQYLYNILTDKTQAVDPSYNYDGIGGFDINDIQALYNDYINSK